MSRILIQDESDTVLIGNLILAESFTARSRGLLGRTDLSPQSGMLLRPCKSIHMWFMQFSIDAAFLDKNLRVLRISRNLKPWQMSFAPRKTFCVLETAAGVLNPIQTGTLLRIDSSSKKP